MVKTKASLALLLAAVLAGCGLARGADALRSEQISLAAGAPGRCLSLGVSGDQLCAVFSDAETTTLKLVRLPLGPHLPVTPPAAEVIDRIDIAPPLSPSFGANVLCATDTAFSVLYLSRQVEEKQVLKLATRAEDTQSWTLDILEPAGDPVALLPAEKGGLSLFWAAGSLLTREYPASLPAASLADGFRLLSRASAFSPAGFTAFDAGSRTLLQVSRTGEGFAARAIAGASPVQSSARLPDGRLAVLTWDPGARRLLLLEEKRGGEGMTRTTVTLCDETTCVALMPVRDGYLFLFDETRRGDLGGPQHVLSLISRQGLRYRKTVLLSGAPVEGFAAVMAKDAVYILAVQAGLKMIRAGVSP
jgi:hypothetical protein